MGDFDVSLIKEFARRPVFYDRNSDHFKDKAYQQRAWMEISKKLGYDVELLRDRMYQLRNRYNLEKRRLENHRRQNPNRVLRSQWPLFQYLTFLDGHIRPRRSYKGLAASSSSERGRKSSSTYPKRNSNESSSSAHMVTTSVPSSLNSANTFEVKCETEEESGDDQSSTNNEKVPQDGRSFISLDDTEDVNDFLNVEEYPPRHTNTETGINVKNLEEMKRESVMNEILMTPSKDSSKRFSRVEKYEAFSRFLSMMLCDLPEEKALNLVEKFTSDVVKSLLENPNNLVENTPQKY